MPETTKEPQYNPCFQQYIRSPEQLGIMSGWVWHENPVRLLFTIARYKFVAKMFSKMNKVLEVGCADGFGSRIVRQEVRNLTAIDFDPLFIQDACKHATPDWPITFKVHDMLSSPIPEGFDGVFSIDVLEHIFPGRDEKLFISNIIGSLTANGVMLVGTPTIESQIYASEISKAGHVNVKDGPGLRELLSQFFANVFIFSMNDELVHTGFQHMAHYLFGLCCCPKARNK